jgi:uncharacterized membrane protein
LNWHEIVAYLFFVIISVQIVIIGPYLKWVLALLIGAGFVFAGWRFDRRIRNADAPTIEGRKTERQTRAEKGSGILGAIAEWLNGEVTIGRTKKPRD